MSFLLRLITTMLLIVGVLLWLVFLGQLYEKLVNPTQKNLSGEEFFCVGLVLVFFTTVVYLSFRSRPELPPDKGQRGSR